MKISRIYHLCLKLKHRLYRWADVWQIQDIPVIFMFYRCVYLKGLEKLQLTGDSDSFQGATSQSLHFVQWNCIYLLVQESKVKKCKRSWCEHKIISRQRFLCTSPGTEWKASADSQFAFGHLETSDTWRRPSPWNCEIQVPTWEQRNKRASDKKQEGRTLTHS